MGEPTLSTSLSAARRLAVLRQHLAGPAREGDPQETVLSVLRDIAFVQIDPTDVVAPSHVLALWNRVPGFRRVDLERLLWEEKRLFEHWAHFSSVVLMEDYPLYHALMRRYPESGGRSWRSQNERARKFLAQHEELRKRVLRDLESGPLVLRDFGDYVPRPRSEDGWSSGSEVRTMLQYLQLQGEVMIAGHPGHHNAWALPSDFLPRWADRAVLSDEEAEHRLAQKAIRALGVASAGEINYHYVTGRYLHLKEVLRRLESESLIRRVSVTGMDGKGPRYVHQEDVASLAALEDGEWTPRISLLPPFDNLLGSRERASRLFGFDHLHSLYLPKAQRKFGYYVLSILWGDRFIGRLDPRLDRAEGKLVVQSVHLEPGAPGDREVARMIGEKVAALARFLGADEVEYTGPVPAPWRSALR